MRKTLSLVLLAVCTALVAAPAWLDDPKSLYPDNMYLSAIGEGDTRRSAESDAAAALARIFETRVETQSTYQERYYELVVNNDASAVTATDMQQDVTLSADQTLYNIQYGESYTDDHGRVHVIGYIDRLRTGQVYEEKIDHEAQIVRNYLQKAGQAANVLSAYACISAAAAISTHNEVLMSQLAVISPAMHDFVQLGYRHEDILTQQRDTARQITLSVVVNGDPDDKIAAVLRELLTQQGFVIKDSGLLSVQGNVQFEDVDLNKPNQVFVRWHLTVDVQNAAGENVVSFYEKQREGSVNRSQAVEVSYREMEKKLRGQFMNQFMGYLAGLIKK